MARFDILAGAWAALSLTACTATVDEAAPPDTAVTPSVERMNVTQTAQAASAATPFVEPVSLVSCCMIAPVAGADLRTNIGQTIDGPVAVTIVHDDDTVVATASVGAYGFGFGMDEVVSRKLRSVGGHRVEVSRLPAGKARAIWALRRSAGSGGRVTLFVDGDCSTVAGCELFERVVGAVVIDTGYIDDPELTG